MMHWRGDAEPVSVGRFLIGEDANGDLCAPTRYRFADGQTVWRKANLRNPLNQLRILSSRLQRKMVFLDVPDSSG